MRDAGLDVGVALRLQQGREVGLLAEVGQQQEAVGNVLREHVRRVQADVLQHRRDGDERANVLQRRPSSASMRR